MMFFGISENAVEHKKIGRKWPIRENNGGIIGNKNEGREKRRAAKWEILGRTELRLSKEGIVRQNVAENLQKPRLCSSLDGRMRQIRLDVFVKKVNAGKTSRGKGKRNEL